MTFISADERRRAEARRQALPGGRFPIRNEQDLRNAIHALGRAKGGKSGREIVKRFIIRRARAMGLVHILPEDWR